MSRKRKTKKVELKFKDSRITISKPFVLFLDQEKLIWIT